MVGWRDFWSVKCIYFHIIINFSYLFLMDDLISQEYIFIIFQHYKFYISRIMLVHLQLAVKLGCDADEFTFWPSLPVSNISNHNYTINNQFEINRNIVNHDLCNCWNKHEHARLTLFCFFKIFDYIRIVNWIVNAS